MKQVEETDQTTHDQKVDVIIDTLLDTEWVFVWLEERGFAQVPFITHICDVDTFNGIDPIPVVCNSTIQGSEIAFPTWDSINSEFNGSDLNDYCDECVEWLINNLHRFPDYNIYIETETEGDKYLMILDKKIPYND